MLTDNPEKKQIIIIRVTPQGNVSERVLWELDAELNNLWPPVEITEETYAIKFNSDKGNGWFIICNGELLEFWSGRDIKGYKNLLNPNQVIEPGGDDLVINSLTATTDGQYAVTLSPYKNQDRLFVLNCRI